MASQVFHRPRNLALVLDVKFDGHVCEMQGCVNKESL